jgi:hypothetical protein
MDASVFALAVVAGVPFPVAEVWPDSCLLGGSGIGPSVARQLPAIMPARTPTRTLRFKRFAKVFIRFFDSKDPNFDRLVVAIARNLQNESPAYRKNSPISPAWKRG